MASLFVHHGPLRSSPADRVPCWMRWLAGLVFLLFFGAGGSAQAATYAYRSDTFAYDTPSGAATSLVWHSSGASPACTGFPDGDDDWADIAFPGGFAFTFSGTSYTGVRVYSNGLLAFPTDVSGFHRDYTSQALPITTVANPGPPGGCTLSAVPSKLMVVYWLDIVAGTANGTAGASVRYELLGTAPNRRLVISWVNVKLYNTATRYNFQVALQESLAGVNGNFKYQYTTGSSDGTNAAVGVQVSTTDYTQFAFNQPFIDTVSGTAILWYPANQLAGKSAEYRFDEGTWSGAAGEIKDTSGSLQNASKVGSSANVSGGKLCRGGTFTNNTSNATRDAVATPIVPASRGSVDFWYKSNVAWNAGGSDAMLFDATTVAARPFFLMKRANGALRFALTDSAGIVLTAETSTAYTFAAATWHHIAVSWSLTPGTNQTVQQIMLDGVLVNTTGTTPYRSTSSGALATMSTLYLGDNRTSGITPSNGSPNGANGTLDEVYIYATDINATQAAADMALTRPTCTTLDHFHIVHSGELVNCGGAVANVTVEAHDATHAPISLAGTTMQMSTSTGHGTWSSVSTINPVNSTGGGNGNYTFSGETTVTFGLANTFSEALNINLNSGGITEQTGTASSCVSQDYTVGTTCDANLNFVDAGYQFDVPNHVSEVSQSVALKAVKKSDNSTACVPLFANASRALTFTCSYVNPASGTRPVRVNGAALNATNSTASACDGTGQSVTLAFNGSGIATPTVQYADVGSMTLNAQEATAGVTMTGTDTFIAAPASFAFSSITASPIRAGNNFSATVTARNSTGNVTPNFGKENTLPTPPEGVTLGFTKYQPTGVGAVNGTFTGAGSLGAFSNGVASSSTLNWSEVGAIDLTATLTSGNYLSSGVTAATGSTGNTGAAGRFIPDHFDTVVTQGCVAGAFTYSGQSLGVQVTAKNLAGAPTVNYDGSANTTPNFSRDITLIDANAVAGALAGSAVAANAFAAGVAVGAPTFKFTVNPTIPSGIRLRAVEVAGGDGVSSATGSEGTANIRSGRARLLNAYGSELLDLPMAFRTEFWENATNGWRTNAQDSCTTANLVFAPVTVPNIVPNTCVIEAANNSGAGCAAAPAVANRAYLEGGLVGVDSNGMAGFAGNFNLWLRAPGAGNPGSINVTAAVPAWLQANWTGVVGNPVGRATFGIYKSPLIYRRENY